MPKACWIAAYRSIEDPIAFAEYGKLAGPALEEAGDAITDVAGAFAAERVLKARSPSQAELATMRVCTALFGMLNPFDIAGRQVH